MRVEPENGQRVEANFAAAGVVGFGWIVAGLIPKIPGEPALRHSSHWRFTVAFGNAAGIVVTGLGTGALLAWLYRYGVSHEAGTLRVMKEHGARNLRAGEDARTAGGPIAVNGAESGNEKPYPSESEIRSRPCKDY